MSSYNRIILMGNLTRDPQLSYTPSNTAVCEFGLAVNHRRKDRDGNPVDEVCFVDCSLFGRGAEVFKQYMARGRSVLIEGRLKFDQWTTPEGAKRSKHKVYVDNFQFVGGRQDGGQGGGYGGPDAGATAPAYGSPPAAVPGQAPGYGAPPPAPEAPPVGGAMPSEGGQPGAPQQDVPPF